jgi:predicted dinucleotide-binding enzyme
LSVKDTDSLAEQIQRAFPEARVVKALNTVNCRVMVNPSLVGDGGTTVFAASDDEEARKRVVALLEELGWRDIIQLDQLSAARGLEMWMGLWIRLVGPIGSPDFNIAVVR